MSKTKDVKTNDRPTETGMEHISKVIERLMEKLKGKKPMKTKFAMIGLLVLSSCNGGGGSGGASADRAVVSPAPSASPSASPSPSPSPSPSATPYAYSGGTGTNSDPYIIAVPEDLNRIRDNPSMIFALNQSINMTSFVMEPLPSFSGQLRGNNFEINNLTITKSDGSTAALFAQLQVGSIVTGIKFYGVNISSNGFAAVITGDHGGRISLCEITGTITSGAGGNGFSTGIGKPAYVTKTGGAQLVSNTQDVYFNGTHLTGAVN